jgi:NAD(P)-dependent dehydrogenase (short-subunit alcohol dehydrogenase family)
VHPVVSDIDDRAEAGSWRCRTMAEQRQKQRVWFVTGSSSGFGRAVSEAVLDHGDRLVATARHVDAIRDLADRGGERALALYLDVTDATAAKEAVSEAVAHFGRIDVVFNNAGYGHVGAIEELTDAELRRQVDVDFFGVVNVTRAALPQMRTQRSGHFVQMSSLNGVEALSGGAFYTAAKFAVEGFSESLAGEVAHLGIKVTIVQPSPFRTRFLSGDSARWSRPMKDYGASVGEVRRTNAKADERQAAGRSRSGGPGHHTGGRGRAAALAVAVGTDGAGPYPRGAACRSDGTRYLGAS